MKECFGEIYPDLSRLEFNQPPVGKVFRVRLGLPGMASPKPQFEVDLAAWEQCQGCEEYQSCFDLSNAKLAMRQAVACC